jgi:hypothetical protein
MNLHSVIGLAAKRHKTNRRSLGSATGPRCNPWLNAFREFNPNDWESRSPIYRRSPIPTGLCHAAQGCEARATLGQRFALSSTPRGLRHLAPVEPQPRWGYADWGLTQGSSCLATLGFKPESRWDSSVEFPKAINAWAQLSPNTDAGAAPFFLCLLFLFAASQQEVFR